jgi:hypothetical protein
MTFLFQVQRLVQTNTAPDDDDVATSESDDCDEGDDDKYQLTQWFPSDFASRGAEWHLNNPVIVTDVTVNDLTVSVKESQKPEGFFKLPLN